MTGYPSTVKATSTARADEPRAFGRETLSMIRFTSVLLDADRRTREPEAHRNTARNSSVFTGKPSVKNTGPGLKVTPVDTRTRRSRVRPTRRRCRGTSPVLDTGIPPSYGTSGRRRPARCRIVPAREASANRRVKPFEERRVAVDAARHARHAHLVLRPAERVIGLPGTARRRGRSTAPLFPRGR